MSPVTLSAVDKRRCFAYAASQEQLNMALKWPPPNDAAPFSFCAATKMPRLGFAFGFFCFLLYALSLAFYGLLSLKKAFDAACL